MARRRRAAKQADSGAIDQLLDQLDEGLANGDQAAVEAALPQILAEPEVASEVLAQRLIDGRVRVPIFAFELLAGLGGPQAADYFERIAEASAADDIVRFGAHRRLGWPDRGENRQRLAFLDTLHDGEGTLLRVVEQAAATWPQNGETLQEVFSYLVAMPAKRRLALATRLAAEEWGPSSWLWNALLHAPDKGTQRLALRVLAEAKVPGAAGPLGRLALTTGDARLRTEATAAAQAIGPDTVEQEELPTLNQALISMLDGDGGQVALVFRELGPGIMMMVNVLHNEREGVKGTLGAAWLQRDDLEAMIQELEDAGVAMISVPLAAIRGALAGAMEINASLGKGLPPAYELWEPLLHESYPPAPDEPVIVTSLDDAPYAGRADLIEESAGLFAHPFFQHWGFEPEATLIGLASLTLPEEPEITDEELVPLVLALATPTVCAQLRDRLRRQAWLLDHLEDASTRDLALAAAAALASGDQSTLAALPFLREMAAVSVEQAMAYGMFY